MPSPHPGLRSSLAEWLGWQESLHPHRIDLGLERCREVLGRLAEDAPPWPLITVAGTNGKGSCVAFMEQALLALGRRPGAFTSPHLNRYNERIRIAGAEVSDRQLVEVFFAIDEARAGTSLTYFEFSALAAIELFRRENVDIGLLEVGLGGRLDASNVIDADIAVVTSLALDHQDWLGESLAEIAVEKAGIFRAGKPAICGEPAPPDSLIRTAAGLPAQLLLRERDFSFRWQGESAGKWLCEGPGWRFDDLPLPPVCSEPILSNIACGIAALQLLRPAPVADKWQWPEALATAIEQGTPPGRFQVFPGDVEWVVDVAHNAAAFEHLADNLARQPGYRDGRNVLVLGMLADKDVEALAPLAALADCWYAVSTHGLRGLAADALAERLGGLLGEAVACLPRVEEACAAAAREARPGDRIVVTGSFVVAGPALAWLHGERPLQALD
ncbi:MAG: bifunctional folylpolyglutamate synthase/dihydrofolate synthase [Gammaproteobacteria bacterium]|nr:bifunctional folylpolyglutamate synthase/dihydrofolate synthase [Gammaproteobacteria bacterium]